MKTRYGFVSNSSSSSFICMTCGRYGESMDATPESLGFVSCDRHGHVFCKEHIPQEMQSDGLFPSGLCPVCNMEILTDADLIALVSHCFHFTEDYALKLMNSQFNNYDEFDNAVPEYDGIETDIKYCEACGEGYDGYDVGYSEKAFEDCSRGHHICKAHLVDGGCPICNMTRLSQHDHVRLALWYLNHTRESLLEYMRSSFKTYDEFCKTIHRR